MQSTTFTIRSRIDHVDARTYKVLVFAIPDEISALSTRSLVLEATVESLQEADEAVRRMCDLLARQVPPPTGISDAQT